MNNSNRPAHILLVEDNEVDIELTKVALHTSKLLNELTIVEDGEQAVHYLKKEGEFADAVIPDLILLDLNLPRLDGKEVLHFIKTSDELKHIPVVVMTVSQDEQDVLESYKSFANCYITKPVDFEKFKDIVSNIEHFWFSIVTLPQKQETARWSC